MQRNFLHKIISQKGLGFTTLKVLSHTFGVNKRKKNIFNITSGGFIKVKKFLVKMKLNAILNNIISKRIQYCILARNYRGMRHKHSYPVRGQRTHTNAKTQYKLSVKRSY